MAISLTRDDLARLYPHAKPALLNAFAKQANVLLARFGINSTKTRLAYFLAQVGHESGGLTITEENLNYSASRICQVWPSRFKSIAQAKPYANNPRGLANKVYGGRMGNDDGDDGYNYRGRGFIQVTGKDGYQEVGKYAGLDLVQNPNLAFAPETALLVACAFWRWKGLNKFADQSDFTGATKRINGGTIGIADRREWLKRAEEVLAVPALRGTQERLRDLGYYEVGMPDGTHGSRTVAAVAAFQKDNKLPVTGDVCEATEAALCKAKPRKVSEARAEATVSDVRAKGDPAIKVSDTGKIAAAVTTASAAITAAKEVTDQAATAKEVATSAGDTLSTLTGWGLKAAGFVMNHPTPFMFLAAGLAAYWLFRRIDKALVSAHREGLSN